MFSLKKILVVGSANVDFVIGVRQAPELGETILCRSFRKTCGGKGANQAYACGRLGGDTAFLNAVGDDPLGGELVRNLQQANVDTRAIRTVDGVSTGMAVVCVDEAGQFVIPLLSGHVGGANRLAEMVASGIGAVPVVTTATDVEKKFAVDVFAKDHGFVITDRKLAKEISADILAGEPVGVFSDFGFSAWKKIPEGLFEDRICKRNLWITVSGKEKKGIPENRVLRLIPRCVALGIGCKRGTPVEKIRTAVESAMERNGIDLRSVFAAASIDIKKQEQGLIEFAKELQVPFLTFSSEELNGQPGDFPESEFVRKTTGTGNVCERSAVAACRLGVRASECRILIHKEAEDGVTVAAAYYMIGKSGENADREEKSRG